MLQDYDVPRIYATPLFIRIDLEPMPGERPHPIILILKIDRAVAILKRPDERKMVYRSRAIFAENNAVIFFTAGDSGIQGIEYPVVIGIETRLFIFPGRIGKKIEVSFGTALIRTTGHGKTSGDY
jgi:hypothetical protein